MKILYSLGFMLLLIMPSYLNASPYVTTLEDENILRQGDIVVISNDEEGRHESVITVKKRAENDGDSFEALKRRVYDYLSFSGSYTEYQQIVEKFRKVATDRDIAEYNEFLDQEHVNFKKMKEQDQEWQEIKRLEEDLKQQEPMKMQQELYELDARF